MPAGSSVTITMTTEDTRATIVIVNADGFVGVSSKVGPTHTYTYRFDSAADVVMLYLLWEMSGSDANTYTVSTSDCVGDVYQVIPPQAVSGAFVETAEVYWAPGKLAQPEIFIEAGSTYLVAGQDETGMYRKVLVACTWVWVRAETVGPNYDAVWNGTPLPTDVVEAGDNNACAVGAPLTVAPVVDYLPF